MRGVGIVEREAGAFDGDDEIDGDAGEEVAAAVLDENLDAVALDDLVAFIRSFARGPSGICCPRSRPSRL